MSEQDNTYYQQLVAYYVNAAQFLGKVFCVIVEAETDVYFWSKMFESCALSPEFVWETRNTKGNTTNGVAQCLKFKEFACADFVICIDSDYRYLCRDTTISPDRFILQTYTYSIENHYCHHSRFDNICRAACGFSNQNFDFRSFTEQYSNALFPLFLWQIYSIRDNYSAFNELDFLQIINESYEGIPHYDIEHNGQMIIDKISKSCQAKIAKLEAAHPDIDLNNTKDDLSALGVTGQNIFLYVRGHNISALTERIGEAVIAKTLNEEKAKLGNDPVKTKELYQNRKAFSEGLTQGGYPASYAEIERIHEDISKIVTSN